MQELGQDARVVTETHLPLEDNYTDVLGKAQRGLRMSNEMLADHANLSLAAVQALKTGQYTAETLEKAAFALNLSPQALKDLAENTRYPQAVDPIPGFAMFTTYYGDMTVNAYLVWDPETKEAASFDTGSTCAPMLACVQKHQLHLNRLFITHTHMDHLADLERLLGESGGTGYGPGIENPLSLSPLKHGDGLILGNLRIRVLGTSGHTPGGLSYYITGLEKPLVVVGDALFASSMGGAANAYEEALRNNRERILTLPEETVICPGHGPLTTVNHEKSHNHFFPEFQTHI